MAKSEKKGKGMHAKTQSFEVSDRQIEIFARRLLPEIKKFFADDNIRHEFEKWQKQQSNKKR